MIAVVAVALTGQDVRVASMGRAGLGRAGLVALVGHVARVVPVAKTALRHVARFASFA